jgi:hypothetical protein
MQFPLFSRHYQEIGGGGGRGWGSGGKEGDTQDGFFVVAFHSQHARRPACSVENVSGKLQCNWNKLARMKRVCSHVKYAQSRHAYIIQPYYTALTMTATSTTLTAIVTAAPQDVHTARPQARGVQRLEYSRHHHHRATLTVLRHRHTSQQPWSLVRPGVLSAAFCNHSALHLKRPQGLWHSS